MTKWNSDWHFYLCLNIDITGTKLLAGRKYMIAVDKVVVNHLIADFQSALAYLFATYYVLNIQYPADSCVTLEFIQR